MTLRHLITFLGLLSFLLGGCSNQSAPPSAPSPYAPVLKVAVFADGRLTVDGSAATIQSLQASLHTLSQKHGIIVTRDSVCMADDCHAPHLKKWPASLATSVKEAMEKLKNDYLPRNIQGGKATWVVRSNGTPLAVIAQQWEKPKIIAQDVTIDSIKDERGNLKLYVEYRGQDDPEEVFKEFQRNA